MVKKIRFNSVRRLELSLWNRNHLYGRANIDLNIIQQDPSQDISKIFDNCPNEIFASLVVEGTTAMEATSDLKNYFMDKNYLNDLRERYHWQRTFQNIQDVGHLTVKVYGASGLGTAEIGRKPCPFCTVELVNARLHTQTLQSTVRPNWNKVFVFYIKDITSVLYFTVYDEDSEKLKFIGKVAIPLLRIRNGKRRWYTLKNNKMLSKARGLGPQILLEMTIIWNPVRAFYRVFKPKDEPETAHKTRNFIRNVNRLKVLRNRMTEAHQYFRSCLEWQSPVRSIFAFGIWIVVSLYCHLKWVLIGMLLIILRNWILIRGKKAKHMFLVIDDDYDDDDEEEENIKEEVKKKSLKKRLQAFQDASYTVQKTIADIASLTESVKNTFNFAAPQLTWFAVIVLIVLILVLHYVPVRILFVLWGIKKFSKGLLKSHSIPHTEILDFLSRVPDDIELNQYRELPAPPQTEEQNQDAWNWFRKNFQKMAAKTEKRSKSK